MFGRRSTRTLQDKAASSMHYALDTWAGDTLISDYVNLVEGPDGWEVHLYGECIFVSPDWVQAYDIAASYMLD